jgi:catechol 2,3-dioxygenase-like lactoylglutathione lyase family enzyme
MGCAHRSALDNHMKGRRTVDWKIELVAIPVSDVDRAKTFYTDKAGFNADHDHRVSNEVRFVQLTPPGSACSIAIGTGISQAEPGSVQGMQIVVYPGLDPGLLEPGERRGFENLKPDKDAHADEEDAEQERYPPAPGQKLLVRKAGERGKDPRSEHNPRRRGRRRPAPVVTTPSFGRVLHGHQGRAAPLSPDREALDQA